MSYDQEVKDEIRRQFDLLCSIVSQNKKGTQLAVDLSKISEIIDVKIPETLKRNAPDDFYDLYTNFKSVYDKFRDFILYEKLIGKNTIALGGGFSSGKSSFLNAIVGKIILPYNIDPSTSVPTYILSGNEAEAQGMNVFDTKVVMEIKDIQDIAHGFGIVRDEDDNKITNEIALGHILESVFVSTPFQKYQNIAFLDTPGYSKPDSEMYSAKTDEQISRRQLNSSNYILWFVQADAGTITEEDIKFIKSLREDIPKLIILNKADRKNVTDLRAIIAKIKSTLDIKGIRYIDVLTFTSTPDQLNPNDRELMQLIEEDRKRIHKQFEMWNKDVYESSFARSFKILFVRCKEFYEDKIDDESRKLTKLNTSLTRLSMEDIGGEVLEPLQLLVKDSQKNVNELKDINRKLKELQDEFFTEIKFIADQVGIDMPEPSEIDLLQDKVKNPLQIIEDYKKQKGIKTDPAIVDMLQNMFSGIRPVLNQKEGGTQYRNELLDTVMSLSKIKAEDIKLHDVYKNMEEYQELIAGSLENAEDHLVGKVVCADRDLQNKLKERNLPEQNQIKTSDELHRERWNQLSKG